MFEFLELNWLCSGLYLRVGFQKDVKDVFETRSEELHLRDLAWIPDSMIVHLRCRTSGGSGDSFGAGVTTTDEAG